MTTLDKIRQVLTDTLQLGERGKLIDSQTQLMQDIPELDSMAVVAVVAALEEAFDIVIDDEDMTAERFSTLGTLTELVDTKVPA
jgi:acyl carrier protein